MGLYKRDFFCYNPSRSTHLALWCSRLARQPVTLEVDGSSPFGVAIKRNTTHRVVFSFYEEMRTDSNNQMRRGRAPLAAGLDGGNTFIFAHSRTRMQTSPFGESFKFQFIVPFQNIL